MKKIVVVVVLMSATVFAQSNYQWLPSPYNATGTAIQDQDKFDAQSQRLSPRNRQFLSRDAGQPQAYDAVTINRYLMGYGNGRVRPVVRQPMYGLPARD